MKTGKIERASVKSNGERGRGRGDCRPQFPEISPNGRYVVWDAARTSAAAGPADSRNVYRHDMKSGKTVLVSRAQNGDDTDTNQLGDVANTDWVAFSSMAKNTNKPDDGNDFDVFLRGPLD